MQCNEMKPIEVVDCQRGSKGSVWGMAWEVVERGRERREESLKLKNWSRQLLNVFVIVIIHVFVVFIPFVILRNSIFNLKPPPADARQQFSLSLTLTLSFFLYSPLSLPCSTSD